MRKGPHPLPVHLGMVAANMPSIHEYASNFKSAISDNDAIEMMRGIKKYQAHEYVPENLPKEEIWRDGGVSIKRPIIDDSDRVKQHRSYPLLLIPSLINKANILDISKEKSMLRWFCSQGIETYLLDWGSLNNNGDTDILMDDIIKTKLSGAIRHVSKISDKKIDVLGYCMGGTLLICGYDFASEHIRRMILLSAPLDFNAKEYGFARNVRMLSPYILPVVKEKGFLPAQWIQAAFATLDPEGAARKFVKFASMGHETMEEKLFITVEDWLNDGVDIPENIAHHCIQEWFVNNKIINGEYFVSDKKININNINSKTLIVASKNDKIVPLESAVNMHKRAEFKNFKVIELNCGHIALIVGSRVHKDVLCPVLNWLYK